MTTLRDATGAADAADAAQLRADDPPGEQRPAPGPWRRATRQAVRFWAVALAAYLLITLCAWQLGERPSTFAELFGSWQYWDGSWYLRTATVGYPTADYAGPPPAEAFYAFFPLFPLLIAGADLVLPGSTMIAAMLVSVATFLGMLIVLYRFLDSELRDKAWVDRTIWYLVLFPTAFFLAAPYPMSLYLMLMIAAVYFMRQGRWWVAGLVGALATASRASALLLVGIFVLEYLRQREWSVRRIRPDLAWVALVPTGLLAYMAYAHQRVGNALAPFQGQDYWEHKLDWPWVGVLRLARYAAGHLDPDFWLFPFVDLVTVTLMGCLLIAAVFGRWRARARPVAPGRPRPRCPVVRDQLSHAGPGPDQGGQPLHARGRRRVHDPWAHRREPMVRPCLRGTRAAPAGIAPRHPPP